VTDEPGQGRVKPSEAKARVAKWFDDPKHHAAKGTPRDRETIDDRLDDPERNEGDAGPDA
jgi:hypothetical protein